MISLATTATIAPTSRPRAHRRRAPTARASTSAPTLGGRRSAIVGGGAKMDARATTMRADRRRVVTCVRAKRCERDERTEGRRRATTGARNLGGRADRERAKREGLRRSRERERRREGTGARRYAARERRDGESKGMKTDEDAPFRNVAVAPVVWRKPRRANRGRCSG
jgi:hypothetical protein